MKYLLIILPVICYWSCSSPEKESTDEVLRHVGDILYDPALDTTDFKPCHEDLTYQYYNFSNGIRYTGEKAAIRRAFKRNFRPTGNGESGYLTVRFIVNCEGKTGWFRLVTMDKDYREVALSDDLTDQIMKITRELDGWLPGEFDDKPYDYYQYLTFKITNGDIEDIMP
ncbi:MAG: hypothetical protein WBA74_23645 [Cyclobacteriaceae bacterium]